VKIYSVLNEFKVRNPVVTIGTFDGVHLGHRKVLERLKEIAAGQNGETVIFTFSPHPRLVVAPDAQNLRLLTTLDEKYTLLAEAGIAHLVVYPFTREFAELTYYEFVKSILVDKIKTSCLVVGYDHKFGKNREGGYDDLAKCASEYGFKIEKLDPLLIDDVNISSTKIRNALENGNVGEANRYLGYTFTLNGKVVGGEKLGRKIGFPTANIETSDPYKIIPGYGVYAVRAKIAGKIYDGMLNIGTRPTFNNNADHRSIEVNLFGFDRDIYNQEITLKFYNRIREERKFANPGELVEQLKKDHTVALNLLKDSPSF